MWLSLIIDKTFYIFIRAENWVNLLWGGATPISDGIFHMTGAKTCFLVAQTLYWFPKKQIFSIVTRLIILIRIFTIVTFLWVAPSLRGLSSGMWVTYASRPPIKGKDFKLFRLFMYTVYSTPNQANFMSATKKICVKIDIFQLRQHIVYSESGKIILTQLRQHATIQTRLGLKQTSENQFL